MTLRIAHHNIHIGSQEINNIIKALNDKQDELLTCIKNSDIRSIFRQFDFEIELDYRGNIYDIWFTGKHYFSEMKTLMTIIAPFVDKGNYITMYDDDTKEKWTWIFNEELMELDREGNIL